MNYLSHIYLSGDNDDIKFGNLIGDFIKGKNYLDFDGDIRKGILMHRDIDTFTDKHSIISESKKYFYEKYHKYSGVIIDIISDHFLAVNWEQYSDKDLHAYARHTYVIMVKNYKMIPSRVRLFMSYMIVNNWLTSYKNKDFIKKTFLRMPYRTSLPQEAKFGMKVLNEHYHTLEENFHLFFRELKDFIGEKYSVKY